MSSRDNDRPTGAQQRAKREEMENETRRRIAQQRAREQNSQQVREQAQAYQADLRRASGGQQRPSQRQPAPQPRNQAKPERRVYDDSPSRQSGLRYDDFDSPSARRQTPYPPLRQTAYKQDRVPIHPVDEDEFDEYEDEYNHEQPKVRSRWFTAMVMVASTLAVCLLLAIFLVQGAFDMFGLNQEDIAISVTIPQDARIADIARILGQEGVITSPLTFRMYLDFRSVQEDSLIPGDYLFNATMSYDQIIMALMIGHTTQEVVRLTFIEGWTVLQIAQHLEENRVVSAETFIDYLNNGEFAFEFVNAIEPNPLRFYRLEGYLFPDTYDFFVGENVRSVVLKFLHNFNNRVLTNQIQSQMDEMGMTLDEVLALASIIQGEAALPDDMRMVSSVFHNRLNSPEFPRLESDVTDNYVENVIPYWKERLGIPINQAVLDAYDTYVVEGLPIGPVNNPGLDAILAALNPTASNFFFFVTDSEGDFYYAVTYQQHLNNIALAIAVGDGEIHGTGIQNQP